MDLVSHKREGSREGGGGALLDTSLFPSHDVVTIETNKSAAELFLCVRELLSRYSDQMYTLSYLLTGKQTRGNGFNINKMLWHVLSISIINQVVSYLCIHSFIHSFTHSFIHSFKVMAQ